MCGRERAFRRATEAAVRDFACGLQSLVFEEDTIRKRTKQNEHDEEQTCGTTYDTREREFLVNDTKSRKIIWS